MNPASVETDDEPPSSEPADPVEHVSRAVLARESRQPGMTVSIADETLNRNSLENLHGRVDTRGWSEWL